MSLISHAGAGEMVTVAPGVWLRNRRRTRAWALISGAWSAVFASLVFIPGRLPANIPAAGTVALVGFYFAIAGLGVALARRVARAGVRIADDGIVIRGPFRTRSVALDDAERFAPGLQGRGGNGVPCPVLARRSRGTAGVWALGQRNIWFRYRRVCAELQPLCDDLNQLVDALRTPSDTHCR